MKKDILQQQIEEADNYVSAYTEKLELLYIKEVDDPLDKVNLVIEIIDLESVLNAKIEYRDDFKHDLKNQKEMLENQYNDFRDIEAKLLTAAKNLLNNTLLVEKAKADVIQIKGLINNIAFYKETLTRYNSRKKTSTMQEPSKEEYISNARDLKNKVEKYMKK